MYSNAKNMIGKNGHLQRTLKDLYIEAQTFLLVVSIVFLHKSKNYVIT